MSNKLKTIGIKGKQYVTVNERIKYLRENFKGYSLESQLVEVNENTALIRAIIKNEQGSIVATGTAFERRDSKASMVNQTSHVENCETSAWGRALGNFGIGIDESVASADEVQNAILNQEAPAALPKKKPLGNLSDAFAAHPDKINRIKELARDLNMDVKADIYVPMNIDQPNDKEANAIIRRLEEKLSKELDRVSSEESK